MKRNMIFTMSTVSGFVLAGLTSTSVFGADGNPTTAPTVVARETLALPASPKVEIFAFAPVNKAEPADWIGRGIQENLQSDISHTAATLVLPPHAAQTTDDPIAAARQDHADLAVIGTYQVVGDQVRVNAHLIDVATNAPVGGFSATGAQHDLFKVEDALGEQLRSLLPHPIVAAQPTSDIATPPIEASPTVIYQQAPVQAYAPPTTYYQPVPDYYSDYGSNYDYGYGYPFGFYGGVGVYGGGYYRGGYYRGNEGFRGGGNVAFRGGGIRAAAAGGVRGGGVSRGGGRR